MTTRVVTFYAAMIVVVWLAIEAAGFAAAFFTDDLFDHRAGTLARIDVAVASPVATANAELGWEPQAPEQRLEPNCTGTPITYSIAADHSRSYAGYPPYSARIVAAGDSYTYGSEVGDEHAYPAQLASILGEPVANLGVGGYDPVQSFLRLQRRIDAFPAATTVVLGIMYENVHRMMNRYRPVLYEGADVRAFKPYMAGGEVMAHPGLAVLDDAASLRGAAISAFDDDFWAKPRARFPYTVALWNGLRSEYFTLRKVQKRLRNMGMPEYELTFSTPAIADNLVALLERFAAFAASRELVPMALLLPRNRFDVASASKFLEAHRSQLPRDLLTADAGASEIDWRRYNLKNGDNICHPSPYGYRKIAETAARLMSSRSVAALH